MKKRVLLNMCMGLFLSFLSAQASLHAQESTPLSALDSINSDLIKKDSEYKLVFFGYAGCYHFCDPKLREIDPIYNEVKKFLDVKMLFVDIADATTLQDATKFVHDVNSEFEAINPDAKNIKLLQKKFQDVYIRKMPDGEYLHSGFLYLLKKVNQTYYLLKLYPEFQNTQGVIEDIKKITTN